jgi:hypothetical protein
VDGLRARTARGYGYMFHEMVGVWPRAGITYVNVGGSYESPTGGTTESSGNRLAFTLELPLVVVPVTHAAITIGPMLDLGISGSNESKQTLAGMTTTQKAKGKATDFGLQAGLTLAF